MLDPASNIAYAASFLTDLYYAHGSWNEAIRHYHSSDRRKNDPYLKRVLATWTEHHPNAQDAQIQTAVFQLPLEPIMLQLMMPLPGHAGGRHRPDTQRGEPSPNLLPCQSPCRRKTSDQDNSRTLSRPSRRRSADQEDRSDPSIHRSGQVSLGIRTTRTSCTRTNGSRLRVKQRQQNLLGQWDRVLMFRAQFAAMR